ncbi:hypothetical protein KGM_210619 [Danaus plexippus plexippus]|uniref:Uncharacterized protein n=1 Tax=Danaus plexippus plexippus TaxID=278856 RepID=A0A212FH55_DANPL|nr:hypothetical protein KGM_210619 [Danaus plexippus plexippus]
MRLTDKREPLQLDGVFEKIQVTEKNARNAIAVPMRSHRDSLDT